MGILRAILLIFRSYWVSKALLAAENLALRHQVAVLQRSVKRPRLCQSDRIFWFWLSRLWPGWRSALLIVQADAVIRWHQQGFRLYWRWRCKKGAGRPPVSREIRDLICRMARENQTWGAPRILSELLLGHNMAECGDIA